MCHYWCNLQAEEEFPQSRKIELVAKALRAALLASPGGQGRFLRPILASFAVVGELESALGIVKQVKERQLAAEGESLHLLEPYPVCYRHLLYWVLHESSTYREEGKTEGGRRGWGGGGKLDLRPICNSLS